MSMKNLVKVLHRHLILRTVTGLHGEPHQGEHTIVAAVQLC